MPFKDVISVILNVIIAVRRNISQRNADLLSDNGNQYLKELCYRKALIKQLA